jgi:transcription-repair coupling factor (superfamily II helicase)
MYQKILDEAMHELKLAEYSELYAQELDTEFVRECQIETDLEILIPDAYISNITERLSLYKELDNMDSEEALIAFQEQLIDRFGPVPRETQELINAIRLRRLAKSLGIEKLILRNQAMTGYFLTNEDSPYYQSEIFTAVLKYVQTHASTCRMKEGSGKLTITFQKINSVREALSVLSDFIVLETNPL